MKYLPIGIVIALLTQSPCLGQIDSIQSCFTKYIWKAQQPKDTSNDGILQYYKTQDSLVLSCLTTVNRPVFNFTSVKGKPINEPYLKGKVIILNFWYMGCAPCHAEIPAMNRLVKEYSNQNTIAFISMTPDGSDRIKAHFLPYETFHFDIIADAKEIVKDWANIYPTTYIIDQTGRIINYWKSIPLEQDPKEYFYEMAKSTLRQLKM
ncbi:thiol-disulfide isomerase/thioredoxin [Larkinella arboricola]|uniref:Thiol-disulfide isomerase/thioredoxin n=1 Tax=Larkinella arboricola TaxID=643671 RepID=A0A327WP09_LARAB|nr:TlpA disulfide reductase family protein [Larkinella arboricola]RAJ90076.1 thiol-disulfide isomerase/thioredoxin [Larkinella arboricola]